MAIMLPAGASDAATSAPKPSLNALVAKAEALSNQITSLGQQYDGLAIQLKHAQAEVKFATAAAARDNKALTGSQQSVAQLAAGSYINQGLDPTLQMLASGNPSVFLNQASIVAELDNQAGQRLSTLQQARATATRARVAAQQQIVNASRLKSQMNAKLRTARSLMDTLDSSTYAQAMDVFNQTGSYPSYSLPLISNVETAALRSALTRVGDPYVWAAAGPGEFDCSGLVVWAFGQQGITLPHYTGSLWESGMHVSRSQLQPGDLVFFFANLSHVGIYLGNGLMVDAPQTGQDVKVQQVDWGAYEGAVRIA